MPRKKKRPFKRVLIASDMHCGHKVGLTAPRWHTNTEDPTIRRIQTELWKFYADTVKALQPIDILIENGDCIDGAGKKSGGTEQITTDRNLQGRMAREAIEIVKAKDIVMSYGTGYHTGNDEDWEAVIAENLGIPMGNLRAHPQVNVNGCIFDVKHHCGSSAIPHGRHSSVAKERLWNLLWAEADTAAKAHVIIRSHVHYFNYCGGRNWLAMTTPALQGPGSKYGKRRCSGTVDFGLVHFDVYPNGEYTWEAHVKQVGAQKSHPIPL